MTGYSLSLFPVSWRFGVVRTKPTKTVWALGPFRFSIHKDQGPPEGA